MIEYISNAFEKIAPNWPANSIIARNPIMGFENIKFEKAIEEASKIYQQKTISPRFEKVNLETIKWCQIYFDEGQSVIKMPDRSKGFYNAWKDLAIYDYVNSDLIKDTPIDVLNLCYEKLNQKISFEDYIYFLAATIPGWAGYIRYKKEYENCEKLLVDFIAIRAIIFSVFGSEQDIADFQSHKSCNNSKKIEITKNNEKNYQEKLLKQIEEVKIDSKDTKYDAQMIFCIDVRSEIIRRNIEQVGNYQTFGYAGFFGLPIAIEGGHFKKTRISCPVLLKPSYSVSAEIKKPISLFKRFALDIKLIMKEFYQSLKYNFGTAFTLAEIIGPIFGLGSLIKSFCPSLLNIFYQENKHFDISYKDISLKEQVKFTKNMLVSIGLTSNFSKIILLCGHKSQTNNNPMDSALQCGACAANSGEVNALIMADILNNRKVRIELKKDKIDIPDDTIFVGAQHNTSNDEIEIFNEERLNIKSLKDDLLDAKKWTNKERAASLKSTTLSKKPIDWSETRPEWGLAKNASFIVAPRDITKNINLEGRAFLHSYNPKLDKDNSILEVILTAPMIVAQWINSQYYFSSLDNVSYGAGSKITHNISGKIGIVQGNMSDLMYGLPIQSLSLNNKELYHELVRLNVYIYATESDILTIIQKHDLLKKLVANEWIFIFAINPENMKVTKISYENK